MAAEVVVGPGLFDLEPRRGVDGPRRHKLGVGPQHHLAEAGLAGEGQAFVDHPPAQPLAASGGLEQQRAQAEYAERAREAVVDAEARVTIWPDVRRDLTERVAPALAQWLPQAKRESDRQRTEVRTLLRTLRSEIRRMRLAGYIPWLHPIAIVWRLQNLAKILLRIAIYIIRIIIIIVIFLLAVGVIFAIGAALIWLISTIAGLLLQLINSLSLRF